LADYGRGTGVGRGLAVGAGRGVEVAVVVGVGVELAVAVGVGLGGGPDCAQYLPPVLVDVRILVPVIPPQTIISLPLQIAV
jgi:hypothetical protein